MDLRKLDFEHYIYIDTRNCFDSYGCDLTFIGGPAGFLEYAGDSNEDQKELYDSMMNENGMNANSGFIKLPRNFKGLA